MSMQNYFQYLCDYDEDQLKGEANNNLLGFWV